MKIVFKYSSKIWWKQSTAQNIVDKEELLRSIRKILKKSKEEGHELWMYDKKIKKSNECICQKTGW